MRKIAANYIMPVSSPPLRNGIVVLDDDGRILEVIDTGGRLRESSKLEFHSGIITPGFVLPWYRHNPPDDPMTPSAFRDFDRWIYRMGIKGIGIVERKAGHFALKRESPVTYHTILELCPGSDQEEFEVYRQGINIISEGWNEYDQACSLSCCASALMDTDMAVYMIQYSVRHQQVIPLENCPGWSLTEQIARLKQQLDRVSEHPPEGVKLNTHLLLVHGQADLHALTDGDPLEVFSIFRGIRFEKDINMVDAMLGLQGSSPERSLLDALPAFTINAAEALFQEDTLGSIETGKKPGLNLFSGMEPGTFRLTRKSNIRVLV